MKYQSGQGAIEYLLIIGAAVIIAVIVIALMMGLAGQGTQATQEAGVQTTYSELELFKISQQTGLEAGQQINPAEEEKLAIDLVGLWHLNGDYSDEISGLTGEVIITAPTLVETGLWDTEAYSFNGSDDVYIEVNKAIQRPNEETYSVWFKPTQYGVSIISFIVAKSNEGDNPTNGNHARGTLRVLTDGRLYVNSGSYGGGCWAIWPAVVSEDTIILNKWNHAVFSIDFDTNYTISLYLNGKLAGKTSPDATLYKPINPTSSSTYSLDGSCSNDNVFMWIGRRKTGDSSFIGQIEEVAFWGRILSAQEIKNLFIKGAAVLN